MEIICIGFKGERNSSYQVVSRFSGDKLFLTNSVAGLTREIEALEKPYRAAILFGLDKRLGNGVRIEKSAVGDGEYLSSALDLTGLSEVLRRGGGNAEIGNAPFPCLCNEAYRLALRKYGGNAVFIHLPSIRRLMEERIGAIVSAVEGYFL
ncbi:MAG: hypothetical protein NC084_01990 [Bacteroides sp.]|nr:hypothetical protein [Eubacterium sp.]MCM1417342.1 hypothetical protein [Roseburia sp.]MCM1461465.1 hypothetical protein [Bacteroides sp.]